MRLRYVFAAICLFSFVGLVSYAYDRVILSGQGDGQVPLIKAETKPYKIVPEDPGGLDVPHQDSLVYDLIDAHTDRDTSVTFEGEEAADTAPANSDDKPVSFGSMQKGFVFEGAGEPKVESLFSAEDGQKENAAASSIVETAKKNIEEASAETKTVTANAQMASGNVVSEAEAITEEKIGEDRVKAPKPLFKPGASRAPAENAKKTVSEEVVEMKADAKSQEGETPVTEAAVPEVAKSAVPIPVRKVAKPKGLVAASQASKKRDITDVLDSVAQNRNAKANEAQDTKPLTHYIQLASVVSEDAAKTEWKKLQGQYPDILGSVFARFQHADLGDRGTYKRIQAGPFSEENARQMCERLATAGKKGGCLVVRK